jgi:hypothetical protein
LRAALSAYAAVFYRPLVALKQNMSWYHPELYLFLCLIVGLAALLAITYELVSRRRKPPVVLKKARPLDGLRRDRPSLTVRAFGGWRRRMKLSVLAVAALAFGVWAWLVVSPESSPRFAATGSVCYCQGCGCKGGPGWRGQNGQCVSRANLTKDCGSPPSMRCTHEGARQVCPSTR